MKPDRQQLIQAGRAVFQRFRDKNVEKSNLTTESSESPELLQPLNDILEIEDSPPSQVQAPPNLSSIPTVPGIYLTESTPSYVSLPNSEEQISSPETPIPEQLESQSSSPRDTSPSPPYPSEEFRQSYQ